MSTDTSRKAGRPSNASLVAEGKIYYTYIYMDPRKPGKYSYSAIDCDCDCDFEPFYVGKGKGRRYLPYSHIHTTNKYLVRKIGRIGQDNVVIRIFLDNISEMVALTTERELVSAIGRKDRGDGPLLNLTDGGDIGNPGWIPSKITREKIRNANKTWRPTSEMIRKNREAHIGKKFSVATCEKMRKSMQGKNSKLDPDDVRLIRKLYSTGYYYNRTLGEMFEISEQVIKRIVDNRGWVHV